LDFFTNIRLAGKAWQEQTVANFSLLSLAKKKKFLKIDCQNMVVTAKRGGTEKKVLKFDAVKMNVNKMEISFATQLFIDGKFVDATSGRKLELV